MTKENFIKYIEDYNYLNESSVDELQKIIDKYPYFQSASLLLLKNLKILKNPEYYNWLKKLIINVSNRELFYYQINLIHFL